MSGTRGIVRHGAAFSKHFAACTLDARRSRDDHLGTPDVVADDADADAASEKSRPRAFASADDVVDVVLAAKDGWGRELLAELCDDLGLPRFGADDAKGGASFGTTEVEILACVAETLDAGPDDVGGGGDGGASAGAPPRCCLHPTELRVRKRGRGDGEEGWRTWVAAAADASRDGDGDGDATPRAADVDDATVVDAENTSNPEPEPSKKDSGKKKTHWHKIKKDNRASSFAALLVERFGVETLRLGAGVVDVAGGGGELAFELTTRWGVPCTIIDPRGSGVVLTSKHKRLLRSRAENGAMIDDAWAAASPLARGLRAEWRRRVPESVEHVKRSFDHTVMRDAALARLLRECSAIVGLHPDQATGAIVDAGLVLNKPWAVVPCCVFPKLYPTRADPVAGVAPVRTTDALVRHLMARAPGETRACELRCEGAKTAVWWIPREGEGGKDSAAAAAEGREDWPWPAPPRGTKSGARGPFAMPPGWRAPTDRVT